MFGEVARAWASVIDGRIAAGVAEGVGGTSGLVYSAGTSIVALVPSPISIAAAAVKILNVDPAPSGANVVVSRCTV